MTGNPLWSLWYFQLPNFFLAAVMYTLIGRAVLDTMLHPDSQNYIRRFFHRLTDWIVRPVRALTPAIVPGGIVTLFAVIWVLAMRMILLTVVASLGLLPTGGAPS